MDDTNSHTFSIYQCWHQPTHDLIPNNGNKINELTTSSDLPHFNKHLQPNNASYDSLHNDNYYACLTNDDTDDETDTYGNTNTDDAFTNNGNIHINGNNTNTDTQTPSQSSSLHDISTLTSSVSPLLISNNHDEYHGKNQQQWQWQQQQWQQ